MTLDRTAAAALRAALELHAAVAGADAARDLVRRELERLRRPQPSADVVPVEGIRWGGERHRRWADAEEDDP